jgi:TonB-dependent SusC/RagA subfamily outer membrane receptor
MKTKIFILIISLLPLSFSSFAQKEGKKYYITGHVVDINDQPVYGSMVLIDNKSTDVITDHKGMYKVKVKADAAIISIVDLSSDLLTEEINGRIIIDFKFNHAILPKETVTQENSDNEAVNIGYGTTQKKYMVTSDSKIKGQKNRYASYQSIYEMIKAEVPGVLVTGNNITIRGIGTLNSSTAPLVIVNGTEVPANDIEIAPSQVKSINILKGTDASIYGSKGANGVILITLIGR